MALFTSEQRVHAYVAEGEANDGGFVQVSSDRGLKRQQTRQISKHIRLDLPPPPGCFAADRPAEGKNSNGEIYMDGLVREIQLKLQQDFKMLSITAITII